MVSSLLRGFISGLLGFSPSSKSNISEFQFDPESKRNRMQRNNQRNNLANKVLLVFSCSWHQWLVLIIRILIDLLPYCILARFPGIECRETYSKATTVVNNNRTPMNQSENAAKTPTVAERLSMKFIMGFSFHFVRWVIHEFENKSLFCLSFAR